MGLFSHMGIHDNGIHRSISPPSAPCTPTIPGLTNISSANAPTTAIATEAAFDVPGPSCPQCPRTFASHIGLVGHLRVRSIETG
ncbi:hypothetical protein SprV_0100291400 [Sparganum proliferum]